MIYDEREPADPLLDDTGRSLPPIGTGTAVALTEEEKADRIRMAKDLLGEALHMSSRFPPFGWSPEHMASGPSLAIEDDSRRERRERLQAMFGNGDTAFREPVRMSADGRDIEDADFEEIAFDEVVSAANQAAQDRLDEIGARDGGAAPHRPEDGVQVQTEHGPEVHVLTVEALAKAMYPGIFSPRASEIDGKFSMSIEEAQAKALKKSRRTLAGIYARATSQSPDMPDAPFVDRLDVDASALERDYPEIADRLREASRRIEETQTDLEDKTERLRRHEDKRVDLAPTTHDRIVETPGGRTSSFLDTLRSRFRIG